MNFAPATLEDGALVLRDGARVSLTGHRLAHAPGRRDVVLGIRPEHFGPGGGGAAFSGHVQVVEPLGSDTLVHFALGDAVLTARVAPGVRPRVGEAVTLGFDPARVHLFDARTERALH